VRFAGNTIRRQPALPRSFVTAGRGNLGVHEADSRLMDISGQASKEPGTRMTKALTEIRSLARTYTRSAIRTLVTVMSHPKTSAAAKVAAANSILDRGWGRAHQPTGNGEGGPVKPFEGIERTIVHPENSNG
jgi:hypothetical protein